MQEQNKVTQSESTVESVVEATEAKLIKVAKTVGANFQSTEESYTKVGDNSRLYSILVFIFGLLPALIVYLAIDDDKFLKNSAKETLNFELNTIGLLLVLSIVSIFNIILVFTRVPLIPSLIGSLLALAWLALTAGILVIKIVYCLKVSKNKIWKPKFIIRIIK